LVASGRTHVGLVGNIVRVCTLIPATLLGYYLFDFLGFLWFTLGSHLLVQFYFYREQRQQGLLNIRAEARRFGWAMLVFFASLAAATLILHFVPSHWLHISLKHH